MSIQWGRVLAAAFLMELVLFAIALPLTLSGASRVNLYVIPPAALIATFGVTVWLGKGFQSKFTLHGVLVGVVGTLMYVALTRGQPEPWQYLVAHALKIAGGVAAGLVLSRRHAAQASVEALTWRTLIAASSPGRGPCPSALRALDYKTGKLVWKYEWPGGGVSPMLTTAGNLLFTANGNDVIAFNTATGKILWHSTLLAAPSNGSTLITYMLDGKQHLLVGGGSVVYSFILNSPPSK